MSARPLHARRGDCDGTQVLSPACVQTDSQVINAYLVWSQSLVAWMRERILDELIEIETWNWWRRQVFQLRSSKEYAEAEALFLEFKITSST